MNKKKLAVIFGGRSGEHVVSLRSAASIIEAIDYNRYDVIPVGISREGTWLAGEDAWLSLWEKRPPAKAGRAVIYIDPAGPGLMIQSANSPTSWDFQPLDVVFPVLHGPFGEDGTIQGLLEMAGLPYVGSGVAASALGMDKALMKNQFRLRGIPVAPSLAFNRRQWHLDCGQIKKNVINELSLPCFVKPANLGSSVGISKVKCEAELESAVNEALMYDDKVIVESFARGREIEVSVIGDLEPRASKPGEVIPCNDFYDYNAKYIDDRSELIVPVELGPDLEARLKELACQAFLAVEASGLARVDFFVNSEEGSILVNEINTMPGFTSISMFPKLWEASGICYTDLVAELLKLAEARHARRKELLFTPPE